jgi:predicted ribosomally synthesized peptide with nif11-like leader
MSKSEIERFSADLRSDQALRNSVAAKGEDVAGIAEIARTRGYDITPDEARLHVAAEGQALTDEALDSVAGGMVNLVERRR